MSGPSLNPTASSSATSLSSIEREKQKLQQELRKLQSIALGVLNNLHTAFSVYREKLKIKLEDFEADYHNYKRVIDPQSQAEIKTEGTELLPLKYIIKTLKLLLQDMQEQDLTWQQLEAENLIKKICKTLKQAREWSKCMHAGDYIRPVSKAGQRARERVNRAMYTSRTANEIAVICARIKQKIDSNEGFVLPIGYLRTNEDGRSSTGHLILIQIDNISDDRGKKLRLTIFNTGEKPQSTDELSIFCLSNQLELNVRLEIEIILNILEELIKYRCSILRSSTIEGLYTILLPLSTKQYIDRDAGGIKPRKDNIPNQNGSTCAYSSIIAYLYNSLPKELFLRYVQKSSHYVARIWRKKHLKIEYTIHRIEYPSTPVNDTKSNRKGKGLLSFVPFYN